MKLLNKHPPRPEFGHAFFEGKDLLLKVSGSFWQLDVQR